MTRDDHPAFGKPKLATDLWQSPDMLGRVQEALKKYKKKSEPFWKQMLRFLPETYLERLFRQAWLRGYGEGKRDARKTIIDLLERLQAAMLAGGDPIDLVTNIVIDQKVGSSGTQVQ